jgi:hypothetical protein
MSDYYIKKLRQATLFSFILIKTKNPAAQNYGVSDEYKFKSLGKGTPSNSYFFFGASNPNSDSSQSSTNSPTPKKAYIFESVN